MTEEQTEQTQVEETQPTTDKTEQTGSPQEDPKDQPQQTEPASDLKIVDQIEIKAPEGYKFGFPGDTEDLAIKQFYKKFDATIERGLDFELKPTIGIIGGVDPKNDGRKFELDPDFNYAVQFPKETHADSKKKFWDSLEDSRKTGQGFVVYDKGMKLIKLGRKHKTVLEREQRLEKEKEGKILGVG